MQRNSGSHPLYSAFLSYVFDRSSAPESGAAISVYDYDSDFEASPLDLTRLTIQLLENCGTDLNSFSNQQVARGLLYMFDNSWSNHVFALMDEAVPPPERELVISRLLFLYKSCFAKRCTPILGHLSEVGDELNYVCYMFWDFTPLLPYVRDRPADSQVLAEMYKLMDAVLSISHPACQESALHGLGHMKNNQTSKLVEQIIDAFISRRASSEQATDELLLYAKAARTGIVN